MFSKLLLILCLIFFAYSQPDTLVFFPVSGKNIRQNYRLASDDLGNAILFWQSRNENRQFTDLYCHYITREGEYRFGKNGLPVSFAEGNKKNPQILAIKENSFLVAFLLESKDSSAICLQEISKHGNLRYGNQGKKIFVTPGKINGYKVLSVSDKYLYLAIHHNKKFILQKRFLYGENIAERSVTLEKNKNLRKFFLLPAAGFGCIVVWEVFEKKWELKTQKMLSNGRLAWNNGTPVALSDDKYAMENPVIVHDGLGGLMCAYEKASIKSRRIFLLRIGSSGKKVYNLPVSGLNARNPKIIKHNANVLITWKENNSDLVLQKVHIPTGKKLLDPMGFFLLFGEENIAEYNLIFNTLYNYFLITWKNDNQKIYGKFITTEDEPKELLDKFVVHSEYKQNIREFSAVADNLGNVWYLYKNSRNAFLQNMDAHAFSMFSQDLPLHQKIPSKYARPLKNLVSAKLEQGQTLLAWEDVRNGDKDIYLQILDSLNQPLLTKNGIPAVTDSADQILPKIQPVKQGFFLLWTTKISETQNILLTMFYNLQGEKQWENPLVLAKGKGSRIAPVTLNMNENLLVAWIDTRDLKETGFDIYVQLVEQNKSIRWDIYGKPLIKTEGYQTEPSLLKLSENHFLLAWMDDKTGKYQIRYQFYDLNTLPLLLPWEGKFLYETRGNQRDFVLTRMNGNIAWAWSDASLGENATRIKVFFINPVNGEAVFPSPIETAKVRSKQIAPQLFPLDERKLLVCWEDSRNQKITDFNLYAQLIDTKEQTLLWDLAGTRIGEYLLPFAKYEILKMQDTLLVTWQRIVDEKRRMQVFTRLIFPVFNFRSAEAVFFTTENQEEAVLTYPGILFWIQKNKILYKKI